MSLLNLAVLAVIQGITEFLPISSSGHLALVPLLTDWPDQGLAMDVAVHIGTLGAVVIYLSRDIGAMIAGLWRNLRGRSDPGGRLFGQVIVATIPVVVAGFLFNKYVGDSVRSLTVIGWTTLGYGILLYAADLIGMTVRRIEHLGIPDALVIGLAQILALVPGTSRSGITMTAARLLGMERSDAARFSMIISIPAILGAGLLKGKELLETGNATLTADILTGVSLSFIFALIAIAVMMAWLKRASFTPFVLYRIVLGVGLLALAYGWVS